MSVMEQVSLLLVLFSLQGAISLCPEGFESQRDFCYIIRASKSTWVEAKKLCSVFGGYLASIETADEGLVIGQMLTNINTNNTIPIALQNYWIDGSDILAQGEWRWMRGSGLSVPIVDYTNWKTGTPDNVGGAENCLMIGYSSAQSQWDDKACSEKHSFICEASPTGDVGSPVVIG